VYKLVFVFSWLLCTIISNPNLLNLGLVFLILLFLFLGKGRYGWACVSIYATCLFLARYAFQVGVFDRDTNKVMFAYIGLPYWAGEKAVNHLWGEALLIMLCTLQRVSYVRWRPPELSPEEKERSKRMRRRIKEQQERNRRVALRRQKVRERFEREQERVTLMVIKTRAALQQDAAAEALNIPIPPIPAHIAGAVTSSGVRARRTASEVMETESEEVLEKLAAEKTKTSLYTCLCASTPTVAHDSKITLGRSTRTKKATGFLAICSVASRFMSVQACAMAWLCSACSATHCASVSPARTRSTPAPRREFTDWPCEADGSRVTGAG
jgi:hypothetical protein